MTQGQGNLFIIAAPSGTGKTTLVKALVDLVPQLKVSISFTTRPKRPGEIEGVNYHFTDQASFQEKIAQNELVEYALIFGNYYGTSKSWIDAQRAAGHDIILEIDWQGQQQIKQIYPEAVSIFVLPPSLSDLRERLVSRNQDHPEIIEKRLADAQETISHVFEFDYVVINDVFLNALHDLASIVRASALTKTYQQAKHGKLLKSLIQHA